MRGINSGDAPVSPNAGIRQMLEIRASRKKSSAGGLRMLHRRSALLNKIKNAIPLVANAKAWFDSSVLRDPASTTS